MKVGCIIQARLTSTRLPGKVKKLIGDKTLLNHVIDYCLSSSADVIIIAVPFLQRNEFLAMIEETDRLKIYEGPELNVYDRFEGAAKFHKLDYIVRITSDDPFKSYRMINAIIELCRLDAYDYISNNLSEVMPYGFDVEGFKVDAFLKSKDFGNQAQVEEHVTTNLRQVDSFSRLWLQSNKSYSDVRITVDTQEDLMNARELHSSNTTELKELVKKSRNEKN